MTDEGKDADLRSGGPVPDAVGTRPCEPQAATAHKSRDGRRGSLSAQTRDRLATQLRTMYDTVAQQPIPDRFAELIARLDATDGK